MEVLLPIGVAGLAWAGSWLTLRHASTEQERPVDARLRRLTRLARRRLEALGRTLPFALLAELAPLRRLAEELSAGAAARSLGLDARAVLPAIVCVIAVGATTLGLLVSSPVAGIAAAGVAVATIVARDSSRRQSTRREVSLAMPGIYRTLSVALSSGQTLAQAISYVGSHERGPAAGVFARMSLRLRCGVGTEEATTLLAQELGVPGTDLLAAALVISHRTGSPLRDLLSRSARLAERQGEFERLLAVKTAQVRLSVRIVCLLPAVMIAVLSLLSPDFQRGLLTPSGLSCVLLAMLLDGVALFVIRRLVRGVL